MRSFSGDYVLMYRQAWRFLAAGNGYTTAVIVAIDLIVFDNGQCVGEDERGLLSNLLADMLANQKLAVLVNRTWLTASGSTVVEKLSAYANNQPARRPETTDE